MEIKKASINDTDKIYSLVQKTIQEIYPKYYIKEAVNFFCHHHCKENILRDIKENNVYIISNKDDIVGTVSFTENHISRLYVLPEYQNKGYGNQLMYFSEEKISRNYDKVYLDSSLPASIFYEKRKYMTIKHESYMLENNTFLIYEIMSKQLFQEQTKNLYMNEF